MPQTPEEWETWKLAKHLIHLHHKRNVPYPEPWTRPNSIALLKKVGVQYDDATIQELLEEFPEGSKKKGPKKKAKHPTERVQPVSGDAPTEPSADDENDSSTESDADEGKDLRNLHVPSSSAASVALSSTAADSRSGTPASTAPTGPSTTPPPNNPPAPPGEAGATPPNNPPAPPGEAGATPPNNPPATPGQAGATPPNNPPTGGVDSSTCPADLVLSFFQTTQAMTKIRINDPESHQTVWGEIYGRHPARQSHVAVALPGRSGEPRHLRGYWVDCRTGPQAGYFATYKNAGHNFILPRATKDDLVRSSKTSMILALKMPWGVGKFHISGLCIVEGKLQLVSRSLMNQTWGKMDTDEMLYGHALRAGQTDLDDLAPRRRDPAQVQRGPARPEPFNF
ncbi:hypothetical protein SPBR_05992 [Sporothrix brasiliensis 5110]|uniref:Uncharacterized protein n=1 Tax=Sporothrix brasiliensis 5110 TaxID=1398154 RepID=A0A0C2JBK0_9PEZI|nr:uncharacterized protein SPBR_05992 [Sporothrix brasiliensis 5110]KIH94247.1 hypothetical protein SPBR_05992 [Sporothrix brasiliensis 5110]